MGQTGREGWEGRRSAEQTFGARVRLWMHAGRNAERATPTNSGFEEIEDPCSLGSLRGYTHLPENPFMVDAGFQVPLMAGHRRLSLYTTLRMFSETFEEWKQCNRGAPF